MSKNKDKIELIAYVVIGAILACSIGIASYISKDEVVFRVNSLERINTENSSYYLVLTDKGSFKNEDAYWQWKFNSSDLQGTLLPGQTYNCSKNFWRVPFLSWYENLLDCEYTSLAGVRNY